MTSALGMWSIRWIEATQTTGPVAVMRRHRALVGFRQRRDLARLGKAPAPANVEHHDVGSLRLKNVSERRGATQRLARAYRNARGARVLLERGHVAHLDRILRPERTVLLERPRDALGLLQVPQGMKLGHDLHALAHRLADLAKRLQRDLEIFGAQQCPVASVARKDRRARSSSRCSLRTGGFAPARPRDARMRLDHRTAPRTWARVPRR